MHAGASRGQSVSGGASVRDGWSAAEARRSLGSVCEPCGSGADAVVRKGATGCVIARRGRTGPPAVRPGAGGASHHVAPHAPAHRAPIAEQLGLPLSTVGDVLRRLAVGRLPPVTPPRARRAL